MAVNGGERCVMVCEFCKLNVGRRSPFSKCVTEDCENISHMQCVLKEDLAEMWMCAKCSETPTRKVKDDGTGVGPSAHQGLLDSATAERKKKQIMVAVQAQGRKTPVSGTDTPPTCQVSAKQQENQHISWNKMHELMINLQASVDHMSAQYDDIKKNTDKIGTLISELAKVKEENKTLKTRLGDMEKKINNLEQYSKSFNLEFHGIPDIPEENTYKTVVKICAAIGANIEERDIEYSHRLRAPVTTNRPTNDNRPAPIIAKFYSRQDKHYILSKLKEKKTLTLNEIQLDPKLPKSKNTTKNERVFINEHLSAYNKNLFWLARGTKKQGYKYAWVKDGRIFIRKDDNSKIIAINSPSDIPVGNPTTT